jgi:hypothetical protein
MIDVAEVKDRLAELGYADSGADDAHIGRMIAQARQEILNFTNLDEVPEGLRYVWVDLACGRFLSEKRATDSSALPAVSADAKRISLGDTSIEFATDGGGSSPEARMDALIAGLVDAKAQMRAYRRLTW